MDLIVPSAISSLMSVNQRYRCMISITRRSPINLHTFTQTYSCSNRTVKTGPELVRERANTRLFLLSNLGRIYGRQEIQNQMQADSSQLNINQTICDGLVIFCALSWNMITLSFELSDQVIVVLTRLIFCSHLPRIHDFFRCFSQFSGIFTSLCPTIVVNISIVLVYLYVRRAVFYLT